ncbi:4Fe-4S dicluster domain-containing protein [Lentibacillus cibarius]|uniref:4Fe-4S dicluster domain-containing protein n=1 Tax=Lentibacillus cibarius TaxID=2583219 RepID=A0A549YGA1_9BACI|nr:4Fe-4S dicluster domain-containing protein [Lentibacillus cibarius]TRM10919.1 4Fe-4S dicluster domain-containing protein [Lentibacillus cibarius]
MGILGYWLESLDYDYKVLSHCSRYQSPRSSCMECVASCPKDAIYIKDGQPTIDSKNCIQCGDCVASCPVQAVEGFLPKRSIINNQYIMDQDKVPTLKELLVYYKKGITTIICEESEISPEWEETIRNVNEVLTKLGEQPFKVSYQQKAPDNNDDIMTRRELFFTWEKDLKQIAKNMAPAKWRFNHESLDLPKYYPDYQFVEITLDTQKCTLCKACQKLCKRNCLQIDETGFSLLAQNCSNCSLCQDICPEGAISLKEMITPVSVVKHEMYKKVCTACDQVYETLNKEQELCVACEKKKQFSMM